MWQTLLVTSSTLRHIFIEFLPDPWSYTAADYIHLSINLKLLLQPKQAICKILPVLSIERTLNLRNAFVNMMLRQLR